MLVSLVLSLKALSRRAPRPRAPVARPALEGPAPPPPAATAAAAAPRAIQRVGVVRFNPYHDTGGEYSFSVALLDEGGSGLLLTGLYHRDQSRVYAKEVRAFSSEHDLMDEEREAIEKARGEPPL